MKSYVKYSRAQMQIQQMAFVLVALMIFFGMVALVYFSVRIGNLKGEAESLGQERAKELARAFASAPELQGDCSSCIDFDKALVLKEKFDNEYKGLWKVSYLAIQKVYPYSTAKECTKANYPECSTLTLINGTVGTAQGAFVNICRYVPDHGGYVKCELGKIFVSVENP
ncbi:hypothetical protein KW787_02585 [Candidatus Pacearchaeota archaeon]|nr:hypothetical protein [Candidatus Pacearchaeota archaeon]